MKKTIFAVAAVAALAIPMSAMAANNFYMSGNLGMGMAMDTDVDNMPNQAGDAKVTFDTGYLFTVAAGYQFAGPLRTEIEYLWQKNDLDTLRYTDMIGNFNEGDMKTQAFFWNAYYQVPSSCAWSPYLGAGIGWAKLDFNATHTGLDDNDDTFAWQVMAGVSYNFSEQMALDLQYRFMDTSDATIDNSDFDFTTNNIMAGLRFNF